MALLTYQQQQQIKAITANNEAKYAQIEKETENSDLRDLLGVALLQDVQSNPANYVGLLDGDTFTYCNNTIRHSGLRYVLAYLVYARYLGESFVNDTFTGFVEKKRTDSEQLTDGQIKRIQSKCKEIALAEFELIKYYMCEKNYSLWHEGKSKSPYVPKIQTIRKTLR